MRNRVIRTGLLAIALTLSLSACGSGAVATTSLSSVKKGKTVYIKGWDTCAQTGDQAEVELNANDVWMIERDTPSTTSKTGDYKVKVKRTLSGVDVLDMGGVKVGRDSDDSVGNENLRAAMKVGNDDLKWESTSDKLPSSCTSKSKSAAKDTGKSSTKTKKGGSGKKP